MTEPASPMAAFVSRLLSLGHSGQVLADLIGLAEAAFTSARGSGSEEERRLHERNRKANWRRRNPGHVPGQKPGRILTDTVVKIDTEKKERKNPEVNVPGQSGPKDDWPENYLDVFWRKYPAGRKTGKKAVGVKLARIRKNAEVTFAALILGVDRYAGSNPDPQYTKAPEVWLNKGCWDDEHIERGKNGNTANDYRTNPTPQSAQTRDAAIITGMGRALERRRAARATDDAGREDVRKAGCAGTSKGTDAEPGSAPSDAGSHQQLALLPTADPRTRR